MALEILAGTSAKGQQSALLRAFQFPPYFNSDISPVVSKLLNGKVNFYKVCAVSVCF